jgi:hypothetical protein
MSNRKNNTMKQVHRLLSVGVIFPIYFAFTRFYLVTLANDRYEKRTSNMMQSDNNGRTNK